jgi:hypothetical protein
MTKGFEKIIVYYDSQNINPGQEPFLGVLEVLTEMELTFEVSGEISGQYDLGTVAVEILTPKKVERFLPTNEEELARFQNRLYDLFYD